MSENFDTMAESLKKAVAPFKEEKRKQEQAEEARLEAERKLREADMALMPGLENALGRVRKKISENFPNSSPHMKGMETSEVGGETFFFRSVGETGRVFMFEMGKLKDGVDPETLGTNPYPDVKGDLVRVSFDPINGVLNSVSIIDSERVMSSLATEGNLSRALNVSTSEYGTHDIDDFRTGLKTFDSRHEFTKGRFQVMKDKIDPFLKAFEAKKV